VRAFLAAALLLAAGLSGATGPVVTASVAPDSATVGDRLTLTLTVVHDEGAKAVFPDVEGGIAPFEVLSGAVVPPATEDGRVTERRDYVIAAFKTGAVTVPSLEFLVLPATGETLRAFTDSLTVTVESVLPDTAAGRVEPKDIRPPVSLPPDVWPFVIAAAVAAAGYAAYRFLRRWWLRRNAAPARPEPAPAVPPEAAHRAAFERLDALEREGLPERGEFAAFYDALSDILRLYVGDRFAVRAIDMTTAELEPAMTAARLDPASVEWTVRFLEHADLPKFAKLAPTVERASADLGGVREFVERTRFRGETAGEGAAAAREASAGPADEGRGGGGAC
jgi:hypothetical protein